MSGVIDAHLHLWDLDANEYAWLRPSHGALFRSFLAAEAAAELAAAGADRAVLVQAANTSEETAWLLSVAERHDFVAGVVGWLPLDDPPRAEQQLEGLVGHRRFCGVRHLLHQDPRTDLLDDPAVRRSLELLVANDLAFDVPDAWPRLFDSVIRLADDLPGLRIVLDHLGKPPRAGDLDAWRTAFFRLAERPNVVAKLSGLHCPGALYTAAALEPVVDDALRAFGADRLMYGGDWPMTVPDGGYGPHAAVLRTLVGELSTAEQAAVLGGTAATTYQLAAIRPASR